MYLNIIKIIDPDLYDNYQYMFRLINDMRRPPNEAVMEIIYALKKRLEEDIRLWKSQSSQKVHLTI